MLGGGDICKWVLIIVICIEKYYICILVNMFLYDCMYGDVYVCVYVFLGVYYYREKV